MVFGQQVSLPQHKAHVCLKQLAVNEVQKPEKEEGENMHKANTVKTFFISKKINPKSSILEILLSNEAY